MKTLLKTAIVTALALSLNMPANATPVSLGGESPDLQTIINGLYTAAGTSTSFAPNVNLNQVDETGVFHIEASGGSISTMIIEVAGNSSTNTLGIYDIYNPLSTLELFSGSDSGGTQSLLTVTDTFLFRKNFGPGIQFSSASFGYYLGTASGTKFYSQASLNANNDDNLVMFQGDGDTIKLPTVPAGVWGSSSFILGWEDLALASSDKDYQDMVVYVESISVPEPSSLALLGLGLAGIGSISRRRQKAK